MQLDTHLVQVQEQLRASAALGDDRTRDIADALATSAASAVRLGLLAAVTDAAGEITAALIDYPGSPVVSVRLDGDDVTVDVHASVAADAPEPLREDGEANARISLRLSEALKAEIDGAAERDGVSVNTWLVQAASAGLNPGPFGAGGPLGPNGRAARRGGGAGRAAHNQRITGWING